MNQKIQEIYDRLYDFESKTNSKKGKEQLYPVHKKLHFSEGKYKDISDWIIDHIEIKESDYVLDAGCGVGYVLTKICKSFNCTGLGISLSEKEIAFAQTVTKKQGIEKQVSFQHKSFDEKFSDKFDLIIAFESIKHSESIQKTLENLVNHLKPGGRLFILDDFATGTGFHLLKKQVKKYWAVKSFYTLESVTEKLGKLHVPVEIVDFTSIVGYVRNNCTAVKIIFMYPVFLFAKLFPFFKVYAIYYAGFCLERLYKKGALEYKAIIATKQT